jgi:hypothetical protein
MNKFVVFYLCICLDLLTLYLEERAWYASLTVFYFYFSIEISLKSFLRYDSHRASLVPEADAEEVFQDIKRGAAPPRSRGRGLSVRHLTPFFDVTIYNGYGDDDNVCFHRDSKLVYLIFLIGFLYAISQSISTSIL